MKYITSISCALLATFHLAAAVPALQAASAGEQTSVSYDTVYDVQTSSLNIVACSSSLERKGFTTFGSLPNFPLIGGAPTIANGRSPNCGKCYQLSYQDGDVNETINVIAIDVAVNAFNIGLDAMNRLTNNQAEQLGRVTATYTLVADSECGL